MASCTISQDWTFIVVNVMFKTILICISNDDTHCFTRLDLLTG